MGRVWTQHKKINISLKPKVFVGMSGGVDSSVAAALLKRAGFHVAGVHMKCWSEKLSLQCTATDDERMARLAASHLGIPFYVWNFVEEYKKRVVDYFVEGYKSGITPNPDVMCNKEIKFGLFFEKARALGADYVATGHYARIRDGKIFEGIDKEKDQSYFLGFIAPAILSKVLFPVGNYTKSQVRAMARKFGLPNAERKDSQGICFVGEVEVVNFLKAYLPPQKGVIKDKEGNVLGEHEGAWYYTIGQRHGLGLAGGPWFVIAKDMRKNVLFVSKDERDLESKEATVGNINWFSRPEKELLARIRYRQAPAKAQLHEGRAGEWKLLFDHPQRAITPGQIAALYQGDQLLAAGVIQ